MFFSFSNYLGFSDDSAKNTTISESGAIFRTLDMLVLVYNNNFWASRNTLSSWTSEIHSVIETYEYCQRFPLKLIKLLPLEVNEFTIL